MSRRIRSIAVLALTGILLLASGASWADHEAPPNEKKEDAPPFFGIHRDNYFVVGSDGLEAKFQVSLRYRLHQDVLGLGNLYLAFTQKSFWDIGRESSPFRESNYAPELFLELKEREYDNWRLLTQAGFEHESNGRNGRVSRDWSRLFVEPRFSYRRPNTDQDLLTLRLRLWAPVDVAEENQDIERYYGYSEAGVVLNIERVVIGVSGRIGDQFDRGSVVVDLAYRPGNSAVHLYLQGFTGYGESLIDYDRNDSNIRFGILALR